ncbi:MAG: SGNH/GDSL hydrolase family protein, partial [Verrucomicrobiota bacterium]
SAQLLVKTAEADLYPFFPDLLVFYVYGSHIEYENIIRRVRERTTAEIVLQTDHVTKDADLTEETNPAKLTPENWDAFMNHLFLPQTAQKYGALLLDQRTAWKHYLKDNGLPAKALLKDGVHLNDQGNFVMAEIVKAWLRVNPTGDDRAWTNLVRTFAVGRDLKWDGDNLKFEFEGNRIDAIAPPDVGETTPLEVWIDGARPSAIPALRHFNRVSAFPNSNWPMLLRVQAEAPLEIEDWTLTLTELSNDLKTVKFTLKGSKTGADGEGVSTNRFVSRSRRIVLEPDDWNLGYCRQVFNRTLSQGTQIKWQVLPNFYDEFRPTRAKDPTFENTITLAQGLGNGKHQLELRGKNASSLAALRVYRPPGLSARAEGKP